MKMLTGNENSISMTYFEKYLMFPTFSASEVMWRDFLNEEFLKTNKIYGKFVGIFRTSFELINFTYNLMLHRIFHQLCFIPNVFYFDFNDFSYIYL